MSVAWTRAALHGMLDKVHRNYLPSQVSQVKVESWVDDLAEIVSGTTDQCIEAAVSVGRIIGEEVRKLRLKIAPKSKVVFNRTGVANAVVEGLAAAGVQVTSTDFTKDLGIGTVACGTRRSTRTSAERLKKMKRRLGKIKTLVRQDRRCRRLILTGAKPQGTWGHQGAGFAPSTLVEVRRSFAAAAMIRRPGGCATTAFGLSIGLSADPLVSLRVELVQCWLEVARCTSVPLTAIARTWDLLRGRLAGPRRWSRVCGPMAAVIATLSDIGWVPLEPTR